MQIRNCALIRNADKTTLHALHFRQCSSDYSPVHASSFSCGPFYNRLRQNVDGRFCQGFIEMGLDLTVNCHSEIDVVGVNEYHWEQIMHELMDFWVKPGALLESLKDWKMSLVWGQVSSQNSSLSHTLYNVHRAPPSTAGVERNHKINKRVLGSIRCRLNDDKVEK